MRVFSLLNLLVPCLVIILGFTGVTSLASTTDEAPGRDIIAFRHVTIIPMDSEHIQPDQTVVVVNGRIAEIGPTSEVDVPTDAYRIDASGKFLIPALCDMHVHLLGEAWNMMLPPEGRFAAEDIDFGAFLFPFLANGITTVEVLSATPDHIDLRDRINRGAIIGPRLILAPMIDGPERAWPPPLSTWVSSGSEAGAAVREAKELGYDKIKAYSFLSQESYDAIIATAADLDMDVIGHIPVTLSPEYIFESGQKLVAHSEEILKHTAGDFSAERIDYLAEAMATANVWMTPTLVTTRSVIGLFDDPDREFGRPGAEYYQHPMQQGVWTFAYENLYRPIPETVRQEIRVGFRDFQQPFTKTFHDQGGKIMTGTDTGLPGLVPGYALHRELLELVDIGLTPYEALRASTTRPFEYLGESDSAGTIEIGKRSDLVLLDENPLDDISAASKIAGVLVGSRWIDRSQIEARLAEVEAAN